MSETGIENRYSPPRASVGDPAERVSGFMLANRWRRLGASLLDTLLAFVILASVLFAAYGSDAATSMNNGYYAVRKPMMVYYLVLFAIQGWSMYASNGRTLGKRALGLRTVLVDGSDAGFVRLMLRFVGMMLISIVPFVGGLLALVDMMFIYRKSKRCVHDDIAGTIVIAD